MRMVSSTSAVAYYGGYYLHVDILSNVFRELVICMVPLHFNVGYSGVVVT